MNISVSTVAAMVDHTNLKACATRADFRKLCEEAKAYGFKSVAINTYPVKMCREMLEGSNVLTGAAVGFPLGQMTIEAKVAEAEDAVRNGCQEFDYVCNVGKVKEHDYDYIEREMKALKAVASKAGICCKVIFEACRAAGVKLQLGFMSRFDRSFRRGKELIDSGAQYVKYGYDSRAEVLGTKGIVKIGTQETNSVELVTSDQTIRKDSMDSWRTLFKDAYLAEANAFADCVLNDSEPEVTGYDGKMALILVNEGLRSILEKRPIEITK